MRTITISPGSEFTDSDHPTRTKKDAKDLFPQDEQIRLVIEEGITEIGWGSFAGCDNLVSVVIPGSLKTYPGYAFPHCPNLNSVIVSNGVKKIGNMDFYCCSGMTALVLPDSLDEIGERAFFNCARLASLVIPPHVTSIGLDAFKNCGALTSLEFREDPSRTFSDDLDRLAHSCSIDCGAFKGCKGLTSIVFPDRISYISEYAFYGCTNLSSVRLSPDTRVLKDAFCKCPCEESIRTGRNNNY